MSKKTKIFLIILPCVSLFVSLIVYSILSMFINEFLNNEYSILTIYEKDYYSKAKFWWIYLVFLPFCILPLILGIKKKERVINCVSIVIMMVMLLISYIHFKDTQRYSTSNEHLIQIEKSIKYDFPEDSTILVEKISSSKDSNVIYEGVIRIPTNEEYINDLENNISWNNQIDSSLTNYFSTRFNFYVSSLVKFYYTIDDNDTVTFLAYQDEQNILFFTIIEMSE